LFEIRIAEEGDAEGTERVERVEGAEETVARERMDEVADDSDPEHFPNNGLHPLPQ
jgi:hypothetical protein